MKANLIAFAAAAFLCLAGPAAADQGAAPEAPDSPAGTVDAFAAARFWRYSRAVCAAGP